MKHLLGKLQFILLSFCIAILTSPAWAALPTPPSKDMANGSNDWVDVGGTLVYKVIGISCIALGALCLLGIAAGILKAYHTAQEKQDLGHFFKMLIISLVVGAICCGLVYAGYQIIPSQ